MVSSDGQVAPDLVSAAVPWGLTTELIDGQIVRYVPDELMVGEWVLETAAPNQGSCRIDLQPSPDSLTPRVASIVGFCGLALVPTASWAMDEATLMLRDALGDAIGTLTIDGPAHMSGSVALVGTGLVAATFEKETV